MTTRDMTIVELSVPNAIKNCASYDLPIQASELRDQLKLTKRTLQRTVAAIQAVDLDQYWSQTEKA